MGNREIAEALREVMGEMEEQLSNAEAALAHAPENVRLHAGAYWLVGIRCLLHGETEQSLEGTMLELERLSE